MLQQWDGGKHCFEFVTITVGGKTVRAQIVDEVGILVFQSSLIPLVVLVERWF
jgi:hypothetical protein